MTEYLNKTQIKDRGWTETAIKRFLGKPDRTCKNPHGRHRIKHYLIDRIEEVEATPEFQAWQEKYLQQRTMRREAARKAAQSRRQNTLAKVKAWSPDVPYFKKRKLTRLAVDHYNYSEWPRRRSDHLASVNDDPSFLARIMVNFLRHEATSYDAVVDRLSGRAGRSEAYRVAKQRVLTAIGSRYPYLRKECERQASAIQDEPPCSRAR